LASIGSASAGSITLYDDTAGNAPNMQPWLLAAANGSTVTTVTSEGVSLTSSNGVSAGYSNYIPIINVMKNSEFPTLDNTLGFSVSFELQIGSETHTSNDRAGFSVILLDGNHQGIELGFWEGEVWAQNIDFTHGEGVTFDTSTNEVLYELTILDNNYELIADSTTLLQGSLRDYNNPSIPYSLPSFLFLGDNTSSAGANITLGDITLSTTDPASVPTPAVVWLFGSGVVSLVGFSRKKKDQRAA